MVSGKYSALAGAISREQRLANISTNLANIHTTGYKKSRMSFESLLRGEQQIKAAKGINFSRVRENFTEFTEGSIKKTDNPLDVAIHGKGFFKVQSNTGFLYTRRGDFHLDQNGTLLSGNNMPVLDDGDTPITISMNETSKISVNSLGVISIVSIDRTTDVVGTLGIYEMNDTKLLKRESDTLFSLKEGAQQTLMTEPELVVSSLEVSNVNMTQEMALMIESSKTFETYLKVIKAYSQMSEKHNELGTIG